MADILVIVVTYNAMLWIDRCLTSIRESSVKADAVIIDNGSSDGTVEHIQGQYLFRVIENTENLGFGAANNVGLKIALEKGYSYVYLLNQDAWLEKDTLGKLLSVNAPGYGILSPLQKTAKGNLDPRFKKKCGSRIKALTDRFSGSSLVVEVPFVMAAHWLVTREAIEKVGGFSPAFHHYGEDDNYLHRLHFHGLKCGVVPAAGAVHDRDSRKPSKKARMELKCVAAVVKLSDPNAHLGWRIFREPLELLGMAAVNFSLIPVKYIPGFIGRYPKLIRTRKASKKEKAFLF